MQLSALCSGTGISIVFLHAFPLNSRMWDAQIAGLSGKYQILTPDLPGFGNSRKMQYPYTMEMCADSLCELLEELNISKVVICGISMGGYIAFELWRKHPEKINALILADTRADADSAEARQNRQRQIDLIKAGKEKEVLKALTEKLISGHTKQTSPGIFQKIVRISSVVAPEALMNTIKGLAGRRDSTKLLSTITVPTLVLVGENDTLTPPPSALFIHQSIPGSEYHILPDAGHLPPMEAPDLFNSAVDAFLD